MQNRQQKGMIKRLKMGENLYYISSLPTCSLKFNTSNLNAYSINIITKMWD